MEFLPTTTGTRPRLAIEIRVEGVLAARVDASTSMLSAVSHASLDTGALAPGLKSGNVVDRSGISRAVRKALEGVARGGERGKYVTVIVPDAAVRVLLLDFDTLPAKAGEALPIVRFRLKKLLPFEVDQAVVSYQIMSSARGLVQVLAVAIPSDVLAEYEGVIGDAGYLPGAVLPSTLAALAGLEDADGPALLVNAGPGGVTTAIVQAGVLLLHRTVDLSSEVAAAADMSEVAGNPTSLIRQNMAVERGPSSQSGRYRTDNPEDDLDRMDALTEMQTRVVQSELQDRYASAGMISAADEVVAALNRPTQMSAAREIRQAVSVAAAYFEDTLAMAAQTILSAGTLGAERLRMVLEESGFEGLMVRETVSPAMLDPGAASASAGRGWMAGVRGALKS